MLAYISLLAVLPCLLALPTVEKRATYQLIYAGRDNLCLSLQGGINTTPADGTSVVSLPCAQASVWDISPGSGSVVLSGTTFALDAGTNPGNNGGLKVWTSYPGLYQQTWYLTGDNRIAITGGDQCLDEGDNGVQTYQCTTGNTNQVWFTQTPTPRNDPTPITTTTSAAPSSTPSSTSPSGPVTTFSRRINPFGDQTKCVTVQNGYPGIGSRVAVSDCFADNDPFADLQRWRFDSDRDGQIRLANDGSEGPLCLDAGDNPENGSGIKIWTCYDNLPQQTWLFSGSGLASVGNNGQCLDVVKDSGPSYSKPYQSLQDLQTWSCSLGSIYQSGDPQQFFGISAGFAEGPVQP